MHSYGWFVNIVVQFQNWYFTQCIIVGFFLFSLCYTALEKWESEIPWSSTNIPLSRVSMLQRNITFDCLYKLNVSFHHHQATCNPNTLFPHLFGKSSKQFRFSSRKYMSMRINYTLIPSGSKIYIPMPMILRWLWIRLYKRILFVKNLKEYRKNVKLWLWAFIFISPPARL